MSFDNNLVVYSYDAGNGGITKKEAIRWVYIRFFNNKAQINYQFEKYLKSIAKEKPHTELSIIKWVIENIISI